MRSVCPLFAPLTLFALPAADLVLFGPARVHDHAEFNKPHQYSTGFDYVLVNGVIAVDDGKPNTSRPGRILRGQ